MRAPRVLRGVALGHGLLLTPSRGTLGGLRRALVARRRERGGVFFPGFVLIPGRGQRGASLGRLALGEEPHHPRELVVVRGERGGLARGRDEHAALHVLQSVLGDAVRGFHSHDVEVLIAVRRALVDPVPGDGAPEADVPGRGRAVGVHAAPSAAHSPPAAGARASAASPPRAAAHRRRGGLLCLPRGRRAADERGDGGIGARVSVSGAVRARRSGRDVCHVPSRGRLSEFRPGWDLGRRHVHRLLHGGGANLGSDRRELVPRHALGDDRRVLPHEHGVVLVLLVGLRVRQLELHGLIAPEPALVRDLALQISHRDEHPIELDGVVVLLGLELVVHRGRHLFNPAMNVPAVSRFPARCAVIVEARGRSER